MPEFYMIIAR